MDNFLHLAIQLTYGGLLLSAVMALARLIIGPTLADRVVSLDLMAFLVIAFIATHTIDSGVHTYLDIAITLALVAFLGTVAFARFIMQRDAEEVSREANRVD